MHSSTIVLATLAITASANMGPVPLPQAVKRALDLAPRQTASLTDAGCSSATSALDALAFATDIPTPDAALSSYMATNLVTEIDTDACSVTVPSSLSSDWDSYTDAVLTWYSSNLPVISSAFSECPQLGSVDDAASAYGICSTNVAAAAATTTGTGAGSGSGSVSETTVTTTDGSGSATTVTSTQTSMTGSSSSSSGTGAAATGGVAVREVGIVGAVVAGVLGAVVAL